MTTNERPPAWLDLAPADRPGERWLPITEHEGLYEVSDHGRVRSLTRGQIRKQRLIGGSPALVLTREGVQTTCSVHRLVYLAFVGPLAPREVVWHLDGDTTGNHPRNLTAGPHREMAMARKRTSAFIRCIRGHELQAPNLVGAGACLACHMAKERIRRNPTLVLEEVADQIYEEIITKNQEATS